MDGDVVDPGLPNVRLTPEEKRVYDHLFRQVDELNAGVVTADVAVKFFEKTRLDQRILYEIWSIADNENRGFLTRAGFDVVLRLIGHAQSGREPSAGIASEPGPLPRFEGISVPGQPAAAPAPAPISPLQAQGTGGGPIRVPPLLPEKGAQYAALFESLPLQPGGVLPGLQAKQVFEKSGLPNDVLGRIWQLADTEQRGSLVQTEFIIAMHLLTVFKTGQLRAYPTVIPASLYETATRAVSARSAAGAPGVAASPVALTANTTGSAGAPTSPGFGIPRQLTGQAVAAQHQLRTGSPLSRPRPVAPQSTGGSVGAGAGDWLVTQADKARFDQLFDQVDTGRKGFITGEEAVEFFGKSKLPEDVLAQIWDLADMRSEGRLDRDAFAIAMYLIRQQRTPGAAPLPSVLPPALVPPSMRVAAPAPAARPPTATEPPKPAPSSFFDDLLSLDASPPASAAASLPPALAQTALSTGGSTGGGSTAPAGVSDPFTAASPAPPQSGSTTFKPFMPSSAFGRSLAAAPDSAKSTPPPRSQQAAPGAKPQPASTAQDDLLTDTDPEISKRLNNDTVELANLSNQITSLSKQMQDVSAQRTTSQNELGQASAQKKNFEARLAQLRAAYEKEAMDVRALQEQLTASRNEIKKLQTDMALVEATYQDLNTQKQQILTALQADQQENAALKEKIRVANGEIAQLRPQIEKLKSEARHQKGLVAISKKQLATTESERDKLKAEADELTKTNEELARQINSGSPDAARQINSASPASTASGAQSTTTAASNPFFRRTPSTDVAGAFSPAAGARPFDSKAFEDVFGPSVPATSTPPPPTTFRQQDTGTSTASAASFATPTSSTAANTVRQQPGFAVEPPSQPESRQITSSSLPLGDVSESLSTSRQVSPPESRVGSSSTPAVEAPSSAVSSPFAADESSKATLAPAADIKPNGTTPAAPTEAPPASSGSDPFSTAPAAAKVDFDSMFAGYAASSSKSTDKGAKDASQQPWTNFNKEFPPIAELDRDDDSDSDSDKGGVGFDDDFAPASPPTRPPPPKTEPSSKEEASSPTVTQSPPAPSVDAAAAVGGSSLNKVAPPSVGPSSSETDDIWKTQPSQSSTAATVSQAPPPSIPAKAPVDDLDDDFEGLEDAKEGSADDDFATISRSGLDDFNAVFDSSPPPSQTKSDGSTAGAFGVESSFDFVSHASTAGSVVAASSSTPAPAPATSSSTPTATPAAPVATSSPPAATSTAAPATTTTQPAAGDPDPNDWDAIFASLDAPLEGGNGGAPVPESLKDLVPQPSAPAAAADNRPPTLGRALTEEGVHDDPILKTLVAMGYSRSQALMALERYDYDLDRAANFLASQS